LVVHPVLVRASAFDQESMRWAHDNVLCARALIPSSMPVDHVNTRCHADDLSRLQSKLVDDHCVHAGSGLR
jgi:hypothetical protein